MWDGYQLFTSDQARLDQRDAGMRDFSEWCWELYSKLMDQGFTRQQALELVQTYLIAKADCTCG